MNEIIIALLALLIGAAIGGVIPWVAYRLGKRNGYAEGITRPSFGSSTDLITSLLPLLLLSMPAFGRTSEYTQPKKSAE